jgi:hypothetical protein
MDHCSEDDLILHHYGEHQRAARVDRHLQSCAACADAFRGLAETLRLVVPGDVPDRNDRYGLEVWQRIRHRLPERDGVGFLHWIRANVVAAAAAAVLLVGVAFIAGRTWPRSGDSAVGPQLSPALAGAAAERARFAAIADHLERTERGLLDLINAPDDVVDITAEQAWAGELIEANRLYRDAAVTEGDDTVAHVLEDLERSLLELAHGPSTLTAGQLEELRVRLGAAALLFRVRVLSDELHERVVAPVQNRKRT